MADGYTARRKEIDVVVCMNSQTAKEDVEGVPPGASVIYEETLRLDGLRSDVDFYPVPFSKLVKDVCPVVSLRRLVVNMIYVGVVADLIGIDRGEIEIALKKAFATKPKALTINLEAVDAGFAWAKENISSRPRFRVERMDKTAGKILIDGNSASPPDGRPHRRGCTVMRPGTPSRRRRPCRKSFHRPARRSIA